MADAIDKQHVSLARKLRQISRIDLPRANNRALNVAVRTSRARASRGIAAETKLKVGTIKKRYFARPAKGKKNHATLTVHTRAVSAISQFTPARRRSLIPGRGTNRRGVKVARRQFDRSFVASGNNKNLHVFQRNSAARDDIDVVKIQIAEPAKRITKRVVKRVMRTEYPRVLKHELNFRIRKHAIT